ncbi:hypothetical protein BJ138DRAFT_1105180 [Hygrophoropsis aurantiaca]|uniref:Uncharacterized protein n=1 Tax=Hygrophoropsis aurantiaca TaxID=72124 RepID=A0ACB7ZZC5_9AGAM|nr:hypothetical protein BJ138DRAFT_1105180 [Hygrophoropsis aurantiaca]
MGRPRLYHTPEEAVAAARHYRQKYYNIALVIEKRLASNASPSIGQRKKAGSSDCKHANPKIKRTKMALDEVMLERTKNLAVCTSAPHLMPAATRPATASRPTLTHTTPAPQVVPPPAQPAVPKRKSLFIRATQFPPPLNRLKGFSMCPKLTLHRL